MTKHQRRNPYSGYVSLVAAVCLFSGFATWSFAQQMAGHTKEVLTAALSPDGKRVVTASGDTTARVWDAADG